MAIKINDKDFGYKKIFKELKKLEDNPYVKVGIQTDLAGKPYPDSPFDTLGIASVHEFGSDTVPERSFIRSTHDSESKHWSDMIAGLTNQIYGGFLTVEQSLDVLGLRMEADVKKKIQAGIKPALSPFTLIAKTVNGKTGTTPLIDTGQMINSIRYKKFMKGDAA